jgi:hypothetical protein
VICATRLSASRSARYLAQEWTRLILHSNQDGNLPGAGTRALLFQEQLLPRLGTSGLLLGGHRVHWLHLIHWIAEHLQRTHFRPRLMAARQRGQLTQRVQVPHRHMPAAGQALITFLEKQRAEQLLFCMEQSQSRRGLSRWMLHLGLLRHLALAR